MEKYFKDHLFQLVYLIPVSFIAIGSFVLNIYLNQFGIIDVALFDSKTIFVGFIVVFQLIAFFFIFCTFIGNRDSIDRGILLIISIPWKSIVFSILVYMYSGNMDNLKTLYSDWRYYLINPVCIICILCFVYLVLSQNSIQNWKFNNKGDKVITLIFIGIEFITIYISCYLLCEDNTFKDILKMYLCLSLMYVPCCVSILDGRFPFINKGEDNSLFCQNSKPIKLDYLFICLYFLVVFMFSLSFYSKKVFPYISNNMGGGYYKYNTIVLTDNSVITGKIIHSNSNYIYIVEEENKLSQYLIDKIRAYEIVDNFENRKETESDIIELLDFELIEDENEQK